MKRIFLAALLASAVSAQVAFGQMGGEAAMGEGMAIDAEEAVVEAEQMEAAPEGAAEATSGTMTDSLKKAGSAGVGAAARDAAAGGTMDSMGKKGGAAAVDSLTGAGE